MEQNRLLSELLKLNTRLDAHEAKVFARLDAQDEHADELRGEVKKLNHLLTGNGAPERGIVVRLDRIEQAEKRRSAYVKACIVACIGAVVSTLFALLKHLVKP